MNEQRVWFDRRFELGLPREALPDIVERLRGTPLRLEERASRFDEEQLRDRREGGWSALEHIGHLADLETLWLGRLDDFEAGVGALRAADLENRATWDADHRSKAAATVLRAFRALREGLVARVEELGSRASLTTAQHPRLGQPMTVVDLAFFVAEHDDHHLATITRLASGSPSP